MWNLKEINTDMALYLAIADAIERDIHNGVLKPGDRLPTQRELAHIVGVNVTTVTRAYKEATKRGLLAASVGNGTYIAGDVGTQAALLDASTAHSLTTYYQNIDLGLVKPLEQLDPDLTPLLSQLTKQKDFMHLLGYTAPQGLLSHREVGAVWISRFHIHTDSSRILITSGINHALTCILSALFQPGDKLAVDCYTYPGIKTIAKRLGIQLEAVEMDDEGMTPDSLRQICHRTTIKGVYTMPSIQNPTGALRSEKRTQQLLTVIREYDLISIEDDMYGYLLEHTQVPIAAYYPEKSIYLAGMSKVCYPGLRTAFLVADASFGHLICQAIIDTVSMASALNVALLCNCITSNLVDSIIEKKRAELALRSSLLNQYLDSSSLTYCQGNMFAWYKLPDKWTPKAFTKACSKRGITVMPAYKFVVGSKAKLTHIRISLSAAETMEDLQKGLQIIAELLSN
ncbi:aminotransferase-like domain-containing protein [Anaerosporobacter faecicola]|uniref:aminotransferase-like domain-containing protein n=1 Tax=Anaerosporobacter faecicola TaxID=2718714 RepID=UPI00143933F4|nr:PLP-dependent aminotransferase family protein [Anaerosporobacter faecicola]